MIKFENFLEIEFGGVEKEKLLQKLLDDGIQLNDYAKMIFEHQAFTTSLEAEKVQLVKVNLSDLELDDSCTYDEFENRVEELGLKLCPLELAAFLRLKYRDQPEGPYLKVASPRLEVSYEFPKGPYLRNIDKVLWLRGYRADGFEGWPDNYSFVLISKI